MDRVRHDRLQWKCRRGLLELDLVLERFLLRHAKEMSDEDAEVLCELLDYADHDLWEVVSGRSDRYASRHREFVARLRAT